MFNGTLLCRTLSIGEGGEETPQCLRRPKKIARIIKKHVFLLSSLGPVTRVLVVARMTFIMTQKKTRTILQS